MEKIQTKNSMSQLRGTVTKEHTNCSHVVEQQAEPLRTKEIKLANNASLNEAHNEFPSLGSPDSMHINESSYSPLDSVHQDPCLPTLAEIDEGFSKLNARSTPINEVRRKQNLCHATNEELKAARVSNEEVEAARVYHAQGSVSQTTAQLHVNGKQEKKFMQQQGTWKRLPNQAILKNTHNTTSKGVSVLQTRRTHEQLSNPNGLPSKRRMVSFEINSSTKAEADEQPRPSQ